MFYTSSLGYRMHLQLFLNGDDDARGSHISLFLKLIPNGRNAIFRRPLHFQVTVTLVNLLQPDKNQTQSFCFHIESNSSQLADTRMDFPSGISKCFPVDLVEQSILNGALFIEITFNVLDKSSGTATLLKSTTFSVI